MTPNDQFLPDDDIIDSLQARGLLDDIKTARFEPLTGGVASDIWKVEARDQTFCVKRALAKLKVQADWFAPVERNKFEVAWYEFANAYVPGSAPKVIAHDDAAMLFVMEFLSPDRHKLWKTELRDGRAHTNDAGRMGDILGCIHARAAKDEDVRSRFPANDIFHAIRLEPYLEATADRHPDLKPQLYGLSERTRSTKITMIHGDVSPKNILLGPSDPVILDAECACIGDPAFDLAFCLNHLLLKCLWTPSATDRFLACFKTMTEHYMEQVDWESPGELETRTASLLPGLFLARVDGKSPVEYVTAEADKLKVRRCARALLLHPTASLADVSAAWTEELSK